MKSSMNRIVLWAGICFWGAAVAVAGKASPLEKGVHEALKQRIIDAGFHSYSYNSIFYEVEAADVAADRAWLELKTRVAYDAYRKKMHRRMVRAIGGLPERTPLNAKIVQTVPREGYRVEKILLESMPGVYVTALLYLPDAEKFSPPYPAFLISCGHSSDGKGSSGYQRACVQGALQGMAACIYDPIGQGERLQVPNTASVLGHNRQGVIAALVGRSMAQFRIWDGIRMIDYLQSRGDVQGDRIGFMGNSGGGTMTSLMMAIEPRIVAAAPSCYLSTLRDVCGSIGPQDAEQNIFGQLAFGLNHAGYVLLQGQPVRMHCCHNDFFPFRGSLETLRIVEQVVQNLGIDSEHYGMTDVPGPHGWKESTRTSSMLWMRRWLMNDKQALPIDVEACRQMDLAFSPDRVDCGLKAPEYLVTPHGKVSELPGFRSVYEYLKDDLRAAQKSRKAYTQEELGKVVKRCAKIRELEKPVCLSISEKKTEVLTYARQVLSFSKGVPIPIVSLQQAGAALEPVVLVADQKHQDIAALAFGWVRKGHPVFVADLIGVGDVFSRKHSFYGSKNDDEELAVLYYLMGKSLVGARAEQLLALCGWVQEKTGQAPKLVAKGRMAIPAAHAYAVDRGRIAGVETVDPPASWTEVIEKSLIYPYANLVNGAALEYDWTDLLKK